MLTQKIEIDITGRTEGDLEDALNEAVRLIREGYTSGGNRNETASFTISVDTDGEPEPEQDEEIDVPAPGR